MITYTVGDKWLKESGTLVFVITQTHFQSPSSQGFRSFTINAEANLIPIEIDDLKKLKAFSKVANKTAIMRLKKVPPSRQPTLSVPELEFRIPDLEVRNICIREERIFAPRPAVL